MISRRRPEQAGEIQHEVCNPFNGAAPESNRPSRGLHDRTGFEDLLGHRARAAPGPPYIRVCGLTQGEP